MRQAQHARAGQAMPILHAIDAADIIARRDIADEPPPPYDGGTPTSYKWRGRHHLRAAIIVRHDDAP